MSQLSDQTLPRMSFRFTGADADGEPLSNRTLRRAEVLAFFKSLPPCLVGMEACGTELARYAGLLAHVAYRRDRAFQHAPLLKCSEMLRLVRGPNEFGDEGGGAGHARISGISTVSLML